jgi:aminopeptidase YwaD
MCKLWQVLRLRISHKTRDAPLRVTGWGVGCGRMGVFFMEEFVKRFVLIVLALVTVCANAQQTPWTVKPEWVKAHEVFLASDAMRGRGSATHDEEITATYVASRYVSYGLQLAPGMKDYVQAAEVVSPVLDGHATLTAGAVKLAEGVGVTLLSSPGTSVSGTLVKLKGADVATAKIPQGAVVVLTELASGQNLRRLAAPLMSSGAVALVLPETEDTERMYQAAGGKTRTPIRLADMPARRPGSTMLALDANHMQMLAGVSDGATVSLQVNALPMERRYTYNAVGYLPGSDPNAGTLLLSAHLDHLGVGTPENGDAIWNGANDDAAGTTAVLELAHALAAGPKLKRSVLFVCYGSEELGDLGSTYFGKHSPVPLKDMVANVEFEMIGNQDPQMPDGMLLFTGWERSNLGPTLKEHGALLGPDPYPDQHYFERSDNYALALEGVVAHTAAGWGDPPTYHRPTDDLAHLNLPFMTAAIQSLVVPMEWLANSDFKPQWNAGGQPKR